jgi:hypothetical protein
LKNQQLRLLFLRLEFDSTHPLKELVLGFLTRSSQGLAGNPSVCKKLE